MIVYVKYKCYFLLNYDIISLNIYFCLFLIFKKYFIIYLENKDFNGK